MLSLPVNGCPDPGYLRHTFGEQTPRERPSSPLGGWACEGCMGTIDLLFVRTLGEENSLLGCQHASMPTRVHALAHWHHHIRHERGPPWDLTSLAAGREEPEDSCPSGKDDDSYLIRRSSSPGEEAGWPSEVGENNRGARMKRLNSTAQILERVREVRERVSKCMAREKPSWLLATKGPSKQSVCRDERLS